MPKTQISSDLEMFYVVDDFTDPWGEPETVLMLHGNAESSAAWYAWMPHLARHYRVVRPDMRGFGASTAMPGDYPWTIDVIIEDFIRLMDFLGIERFHLVAAKIGGTIARAFAARHPDRVRTLTLAGTPPPRRENTDAAGMHAKLQDERIAALKHEFETLGVEHWARQMMAERLGSEFPAEGVEWWIQFMGRTQISTEVGFMSTIALADVSADMPHITCPTLVITGEGSAIASVQQTRTWQKSLKNSELVVLSSSSFHIAVTHAERCAKETLKFIMRSNVA